MKILCYGDSNTWGYNPENGSQFSRPWPAVLKERRVSDEIVSDGLCGRATQDDTGLISESDGGKTFFRKYINADFRSKGLIIMIGSNDLSVIYPNRTPEEISGNIQKWISAFRRKMGGDGVHILVIAPVRLNEHCLTHPMFGELFNRTSLEKSERLTDTLREMSQKENVLFLDANTVACASAIDGLHMEASGHIHLANAIDQILGQSLSPTEKAPG